MKHPFRSPAAWRAMLAAALVPSGAAVAQAAAPPPVSPVLAPSHAACPLWAEGTLPRNPTARELRCRYGVRGPGRFGLSEYMDVPVYQPATPLPGTHVVGVPGMPGPRPGESFEAWEWRVLRTEYPPAVRAPHRGLEVLDPVFAARLLELEAALAQGGVRFGRRETWRSPARQEWLFQQGRSRPGPMVTATLTSWHSRVDERGVPAARAADYDVPRSQMQRFHEIAWAVGLETYGPQSNDPGHVYLKGAEAFPGDELALLRLLPRIPVVTIATGRPTDETVARHERAIWRDAAIAFASEPFFPAGEIRLAGGRPRVEPRTVAASAPPTPNLEPPPPPAATPLAALLRLIRGSR